MRRGLSTPSGPLLLIALPAIVYIVINNYVPIFGIVLAFKQYDYVKGIWGSAWNGLANFAFLFKTRDALVMVRNTLLYNIAFIVCGTVFSIFIAILLHELGKSRVTKVSQSALLLPYLLSWVVISYIGYAFLSSDTGFLNGSLLKLFGRGEGIAWYSESRYWPFILLVVYLWKNLGYMAIIYLAAITGIDKEVFEAARIDGASKMRQIMSITLPLLKPTVVMLVLMSIGRIFYSDFGLFYQVPMNSGALYGVTQTIDTYVYRGLMRLNDVGMTAAAGLFQSIVGFILVMTANGITRKVDRGAALF
jgi:putative aldouronate transport system permease protein